MKKTRLTLMFVLMLLCVGLVFSLTSCGDDNNEHIHTPNSAVRENEIAATCASAGSYDEVVYCAECSEEISRTTKVIEKLSHTPSEWIIDTEATCKAEGTKHKECTVCHGVLETDKIDKLTTHTPAEAVRENEIDSTCSELGFYDEVVYCSVCEIELSREEKETSLKDHTSSEWITDTEATCKAEGTKHKECTECHTVLENGEIDKLTTHTPAEAVMENEVAAKCDTFGSYDEVIYCSVCDIQISRTPKEIAKLPHTEVVDEAVEATDTIDGLTEGKHCGVCGETIIAQQIIPANLQGTAIKSKILTVDGDRIYGSVSNTTTIFSFLNDITVNGNASYILSRDIECENEITSKTVGIDIGDNIFYILVTNGKNAKLYTVTLRRLPMYTVSFNTNGGTELETISFEEGEFDYPETSKRGYNLDGWKVNGNLVSFPYTVTENTEFEAVFSPIVYEITYEIFGGVNAEENPDTYTIETSTIMLETPTRDYYDFAGWYVNADFEGDAVTQIAIGSIGEVQLFAKWTPTVYEIKYNLNGGINAEENPDSYTVETGTITFANPTRVGYTFKGWFVDKACTKSITEIPHGSHGTVEIYTKWETIVYNIDYELSGGVNSENNLDTYTIETSTITLATPSRDYYDFVGWYDNADFEGDAVTQIALGSIGDITLYAKWTPTVYAIMYNLNGGVNAEGNPKNYTVESDTITFAKPTRVGYVFIGWYIDEECAISVTEISHGSHDEVEIYAKWEGIYIVSNSSIICLTDYAKNNVTELNIPYAIDGAEITSIGSSAFEGCTSLTSVTIPDSIMSIGENAFYKCTSLTSVYIKDIVAWCEISFGANFANPVYYANNLYLNGKLVVDLVIPDSVTTIGDWAFRGCSSLANLIIPNSVTSIGSFAFIDCTNLASVTIGNGVTYIGDCAFRDCTSLANITIDETNPIYQSIDGNLYNKDATKLINYAIGKNATSFAIPNTVTSIGENAFYKCTSLASVTIPNSVRNIGDYAFSDCDSLTSIIIPDSVISIGSQVFCHCDRLTSATIGNGVTNISTQAFSYCEKLTSITIPDSVTSIGDWAFHACSNLAVIEMPDSLTSIGDYAFSDCDSLTSIVIPDGVTSINDYTFSGCENLTSIIIPYSVTNIGDCAFYYCDSLTNIKYRGTEEQWSAISKSWNWNYNSGLYFIIYNYTDN